MEVDSFYWLKYLNSWMVQGKDIVVLNTNEFSSMWVSNVSGQIYELITY